MEKKTKDEEKGEILGRPMKQDEDKKGRQQDTSYEGTSYEGKA